MYFLRKQLKFKDEMINSLLNQLAKCIDMLQLQQSNQSSSSSSSSSSLSSSSPSSLSSSSSSSSPSSSSLCHERNNYLIDHSKKIKSNHLNKSKLHLNKNGSDILSRSFANEISRVFN